MAKRAGPPGLGASHISLLKTERDQPSQIRWSSPKSHPALFSDGQTSWQASPPNEKLFLF